MGVYCILLLTMNNLLLYENYVSIFSAHFCVLQNINNELSCVMYPVSRLAKYFSCIYTVLLKDHHLFMKYKKSGKPTENKLSVCKYVFKCQSSVNIE